MPSEVTVGGDDHEMYEKVRFESNKIKNFVQVDLALGNIRSGIEIR